MQLFQALIFLFLTLSCLVTVTYARREDEDASARALKDLHTGMAGTYRICVLCDVAVAVACITSHSQTHNHYFIAFLLKKKTGLKEATQNPALLAQLMRDLQVSFFFLSLLLRRSGE